MGTGDWSGRRAGKRRACLQALVQRRGQAPTRVHPSVAVPSMHDLLPLTSSSPSSCTTSPPQVKVTTVDGPVELKIPPGTQPGTTLLMAKRGVPRLGSPSVRGDHMVHVRVKIPKQLAAEERKLVEELKELQSKTKVGAVPGAARVG